MITRMQWRPLLASSFAIILAAAMMVPATTDARGGGSFGGRSGAMTSRVARFGAAGTIQNNGPAIAGPATVRRFPFSSGRSVSPKLLSSNMFFARRFALHRSRAIGSHVLTLGSDGIWLDSYVYAPTVLVAQQPVVAEQQPTRDRAPSVKAPSMAGQGVILVRGDSKTFITFPSGKPG